jgi:hypothetical protein
MDARYTAKQLLRALIPLADLVAAGSFTTALAARTAGASLAECVDAKLVRDLREAKAAGYHARECLDEPRLFALCRPDDDGEVRP